LLATDDPGKSAEMLEEEFMANIRQANFLYVANVGGYVGQSVAAEMGVAATSGIPIIAAEEIKEFSTEIPEITHALLRGLVALRFPIEEINGEGIAGKNLAGIAAITPSLSEKALLESLKDELLKKLKLVRIKP
jgi:ribosomal protein S9